MDLGIAGKVALVAASSKGIGRAIAMAFAGEGARVALCAREAEPLRSTADAIRRETGAEIFYTPADLTRQKDVEALVKETQKALGPVDILVNNAGGPPTGTFASLSDQDFRDAVELNLMSGIALARQVVGGMVERRWGRIVNLTSISVKQPIDNLILSNTARAAVIGWAKTLSNEVAPFGVTVNNVCPGYTHTQRVEELAVDLAARQKITAEEVLQRWESVIPMARLGRPEEIADAVLFLVSERASYVTGVSVQVDGGFIRGLF